MELIGFRHPSPANLLANYLNKQHIIATVESNDQHGYVVYLKDDSQYESAKVIVTEFLKNPTDSKYQDAAWQQLSPADVQNNNSNMLNSITKIEWRDVPIVSVLLVVCAFIYGFSIVGGFGWVKQHLMILPISELVTSQQWWRLFTPAIIHFSELHIVFNLLWWWILGGQIERIFGSVFLTMLFGISASVSNLAQLYASGINFGGLSGVVYALLGFVWWMGWLRPSWGLSLPKPIIGFMLVWLLIGYADVLWVSMANTAHLSGLISGCLMALLTIAMKK